MKDLKDKRVLVTGAGAGIGRGVALAFAKAGSMLLLADIDQASLDLVAEEVEASGAHCRTYLVDVSSQDDVERFAAEIDESLGGVDILVNNAGVCVVADILDTTPDDWEWLMGVNLWGAIYTTRCFLPGMIERREGHIVNISSGAGLFGLAALGAYCTTKFALVGLSEALVQEVREHNIGVTTVCPGATDTPILGNMRFRGYSREKMERFAGFFVKRGTPTERIGERITAGVLRNRPVILFSLFVRFHYTLKRLSLNLFLYSTRLGRKILLALR